MAIPHPYVFSHTIGYLVNVDSLFFLFKIYHFLFHKNTNSVSKSKKKKKKRRMLDRIQSGELSLHSVNTDRSPTFRTKVMLRQ